MTWQNVFGQYEWKIITFQQVPCILVKKHLTVALTSLENTC
jgi:hypothetical protein